MIIADLMALIGLGALLPVAHDCAVTIGDRARAKTARRRMRGSLFLWCVLGLVVGCAIALAVIFFVRWPYEPITSQVLVLAPALVLYLLVLGVTASPSGLSPKMRVRALGLALGITLLYVGVVGGVSVSAHFLPDNPILSPNSTSQSQEA